MSDITYELIKKSLDAVTLRQKVTANNIANINTKGFKRSEVVFESMLKDELNKIKNDPESINGLKAEVVKDNSTGFREDGNNIDLDFEMSNMAANNIMYNTLINQLNTKLSVKKIIIEGK